MKNAEVRCGGCFSRRWRASNDDAMTTKRQTFIAMKLLLLLTAAAWLQTSARGYGQTISLTLKNSPLDKVFAAIEKQSPYHFIYAKEELAGCKAVTVSITSASIQAVLDLCLKEQPLMYALHESYIIIKRKNAEKEKTAPINKILKGKVVNEKGDAIAGATVSLLRSNIATATDDKGEFHISYTGNYTHVLISSVGYEREEIALHNREYIEVVMRIAIGSLDETVVIAYGRTTKRLNTGSVSKVSAAEIERQPVSNPLAALQGRVPGLVVTQTSGLNGAAFKVQLRGQNSILQGSEPLFVIDGVPFAPGNTRINLLNSAAFNGLSPFATLNPADIESIEVLKDADATAIYGSRGANGVILISTKKGKSGKTYVNANIYTGFSRITRTMDMLSTPQYLAMKREAYANDGLIPHLNPANAGYAPELLEWDTTLYTDFKKLLIGNTAQTYDAQLSLSGGNAQTRFLLNGGLHKETTVMPTDLSSIRASVHSSLQHESVNKKFLVHFTTTYSYFENQLPISDLTGYINMPPHIHLYDSTGRLNWSEKGISFLSLNVTNPLSFLEMKYRNENEYLNSNLQLNYTILKGLQLRTSIGYNTMTGHENAITPSTAIDPATGQLPYAKFSNSQKRSWIAEPQLEYHTVAGRGRLQILAGGTWQSNRNRSEVINGSNYSSDLLLNSVSGAGTVSANNSYSEYHYAALFGRINYNWRDKYIVNLTGRRDASSRFGPGKQAANFGAIGAGWIFSEEPFFKKVKALSFGKIRASYGKTGNDQIGDYAFLDTWTASQTTYQGVPMLNPTRLHNPDYAWEINRKLEAALEIGLFKNTILVTAAYYQNRSGNQLVSYTLPIQAGFSSVQRNLDALVENKGYELSLMTENIQTVQWKWNSNVNVSLSRNKLLRFPGLATSSYSNTYFTGEPLSVKRVYDWLGVDPLTGVYVFRDIDSSGSFGSKDRIVNVNTDPVFYGGIQQSLRFRAIELNILFEFKKQTGLNYLNTQSFNVPGYGRMNQPVIVLDRWQRAGDITSLQRFTADYTTAAYTAASSNLGSSSAVYSDASYVRCKNVSLSYHMSNTFLKKCQIESGRVYVSAQNLFTITRYKGADPENQNLYVLPPLKTIVLGIQLQF